MDTYFTGQVIRISAEFRDDGGDLADPTTVDFGYRVDQAAAVAFVYGEDVELVKDAVGQYYIDITLATAGTYACQFTGGGAIESTVEDTFLVLTALATAPLVELTVAKDYLRVSGTDEDSLIHAMLSGIEATIKENLSNYIVAQETSVYLDGGRESLRLPRVPVSEESGDEIVVTDDIWSETLSAELYRLIPTTGQILYLREGDTWPEGVKRYLVTYTSGFSLREDYAEIVERIKLAELTWLGDIFFQRGASVKKEAIDEVSQAYEMTKDLPSNVRTLLQGLLDVLSDF